MIKLIHIVPFLLLSGFAHATTYKMAFEIKDGIEPLQTGSIIVQEGEDSIITSKNKVIRLKPVSEGDGTVKISTTVLEGAKVLYSPTVIVRLGQSAEITQSTQNEQQKNSFSLKWMPELASK